VSFLMVKINADERERSSVKKLFVTFVSYIENLGQNYVNVIRGNYIFDAENGDHVFFFLASFYHLHLAVFQMCS